MRGQHLLQAGQDLRLETFDIDFDQVHPPVTQQLVTGGDLDLDRAGSGTAGDAAQGCARGVGGNRQPPPATGPRQRLGHDGDPVVEAVESYVGTQLGEVGRVRLAGDRVQVPVGDAGQKRVDPGVGADVEEDLGVPGQLEQHRLDAGLPVAQLGPHDVSGEPVIVEVGVIEERRSVRGPQRPDPDGVQSEPHGRRQMPPPRQLADGPLEARLAAQQVVTAGLDESPPVHRGHEPVPFSTGRCPARAPGAQRATS